MRHGWDELGSGLRLGRVKFYGTVGTMCLKLVEAR